MQQLRRAGFSLRGESQVSDEIRITEEGKAVVESGLSLRQAHEIKTGCAPDALCAECVGLLVDEAFENPGSVEGREQ